MGKTSYKNTAALVEEINEKLTELNKGNLNLDDLNTLVDTGKDLYEQLIILRYKAFDKLGGPNDSPKKATPEKPVVKEEKVIEEVEESIDFSAFAQEETPQPSFDFSIRDEEQKAKSANTAAEEEKQEPVFSASEEEEEDDGSESLNESLKNEDDQTLRKQLQNSPISDIKTHISIAKKFEYISNMFAGDVEAYDEGIDFLNTCATGKDARLKLNEYTTKYSWDLEDKSIIKFIELVERRYL